MLESKLVICPLATWCKKPCPHKFPHQRGSVWNKNMQDFDHCNHPCPFDTEIGFPCIPVPNGWEKDGEHNEKFRDTTNDDENVDYRGYI